MAFTDDLRGLSQAGQIARVQAVAREHGDELTDREASNALSLYLTQATAIHASRDGRRMLPLTMAASDARSYATALQANGFTVQLRGSELCPCDEPRDMNGDCPGSWHGCDYHNEEPEPDLEAGS
jgi:hypothetical protein